MKSKCLSIVGSSIVFCAAASGANITWDITPGSVGAGDGSITGSAGDWNTTNGNWSADAGVNNIAWNNAANDTAVFSGTGGAVNVSAPVTIGGMTLSSTGYTVAGGNLALGGTVVTVNAASAGTVNSIIEGTAEFFKTGTANLTLGGVNTFTGVTRIGNTTTAGGTLTLSVGNALAASDGFRIGGLNSTNGTLATLALGATNQTVKSLQVLFNPDSGQTSAAVVTGAGKLTVNGASDFSVVHGGAGTQGSTTDSVAHLNLSGLSDFEFSGSSNKVLVQGGSAANNRAGRLTLGATSKFTATSFDVHNVTAPSGDARRSDVFLGSANIINSDTINVLTGNSKDSAGIAFRSGLATGPTIKIRGTGGLDSNRANVNIGTTATSTNSGTGAGSIDLATNATTSVLDAMVGTLQIGSRSAGSNTHSASFIMAGGTLDATTINLGTVSTGGLNSTLTIGGGTVKASTLGFGNRTGGTLVSVVNLNSNGTIAAGTVGISGTATRTLNWNAGTIANYDSATDLNVASGISIKLAATGTHTFDIGAGRSGAVASDLSDATSGGALVKSGAGSLTLAGINTYTGGTTVNAGTLQLASGAQLKFVLGATSGSNNSISGAGTVVLDGSFNIDRTAALSLTSGSWTLESVSALTGPYGSAFSVSGFTDTGSNTWTLIDGAKHWVFDETTGVLTLSTVASHLNWSGSVDANWDVGNTTNWLNGVSSSSYGAGDHATFDDAAIGTTNIVLDATVTPETVVFNNTSKNYTLTGTGSIGGFGTLTKSGTGTVVIATTNTYSGGTTIHAGVLQVGNGGTAGSLGGGAISNNGSLIFNRSDSLTISSVISGTGSITQSGSGTTILSADNTYSGATTISAGTLQVGAGGATGTLGSTSSITNNGTLAFNTSGTVTLNQDITGAGNLAQNGSGALILPLDMSYTGSTTINSGTLQLGTGGTTGSVLSPSVTDNGNLVINRSDDLDFAANISGSGSVTHTGAGLLRLTGINTYGGNTVINGGGTLRLDSAGSQLPANTGLAISNGTLDFTDTHLTVSSLSKPPSGSAWFYAEPGKTLTVAGGNVTVNQGQLGIGSLDAFVMDQPTGTFSVVPTVTGTTATANMAFSNSITALNFQVGVNGPSGSNQSSTSEVYLKDSSVIQADTIKVGSNGAQSGYSALRTSPSAGSSTVTIRGSSGGSSRANLTIGEKSGSDYAGGSGTVDFSSYGTNLDAMIGTLIIGRHADGAGNFNNATSGSFLFNTGTLDATSIIMAIGATVNAKTANGTLTTYGGSIRAGALTMVQDSGGTMGNATVNLYDGGSLAATTIAGQAAANAIVNLENGTLRNLTDSDLTVTHVKFPLAPTATPAVSVQPGHTATFGAGSELSYTFDSSAVVPATTTLSVSGAVVLGGASLSITDIAGTPVAVPDGTKFVLANYSGGSVSGGFSGLGEGSTLTVGPNKFTVSYADASQVTLTTTSGTAYDAWLASQGLMPGAANTAPGDDYDNDGLDNMVEYVLNSNPAAGTPANLPVCSKSGSNFVFTFTRLKEAVSAGFTTEVQYSTTLGGFWSSALPGMIGSPVDNGTTETVTVSIPIPGGASELFARLKVNTP